MAPSCQGWHSPPHAPPIVNSFLVAARTCTASEMLRVNYSLSTKCCGGLLLATLGLLAGVAQGDDFIPRRQDKPPGPALSPAEAIARMKVPEGFTVELVASEPDIVNPVAMTFDERGRIWITESLEYPRQSAGPGPRPRQDSGRHQRRRTGRQVHRLRRGAEHSLRHCRRGAAACGLPTPPTSLFMQDTDGDGTSRPKRGRRHRLRPQRHARVAQFADLGP